MIYAAIIAAAAALIGAAISAGENAKAQAIRQSVADKYKDLPLPVLDKVVAQKLPPDAADRYLKSTQATQMQGDVLGKYQEEINAKGETPEDRAAYLRMKNEAAGIANSAQGANTRAMANRGLGNSGMAFAVGQQGAQGAINRANEMGIQGAADARGRYMQALQAGGSMAGQMRGQELNALSAIDSLNEFNARQQSAADEANNANKQANFANQMNRLGGEANALNGVATGYDQSAAGTRQTAGGIGQAAISAGAAYDQYGNPVKKKPDDYEQSAGA